MRQKLLRAGADELSYEIRGIVEKAEFIQKLGRTVYWENIGDPIQKNAKLPDWMKAIISQLVDEDHSYGYSHSKGVPATREFIATLNNKKDGAQITAEDITFFNGLGDAIARLYEYILPTSRIIGPSPAYSTHSSSEAAHANQEPITYRLNPAQSWLPDMEDLRNKIKYNPSIVGILIINPDNPTGMVYPREILQEIVALAKKYNLFLIGDEIYMNITYNGARQVSLAEVIEDVPGISLKGISKEWPWPGSRCGWVEYYNRKVDKDFEKLCKTLDNAKMVEVCSTKLPQLAIPKIMSDPRYPSYLEAKNKAIGERSERISSFLSQVKGIRFNPTYGAFYNTIIFEPGVLKPNQKLAISDPKIKDKLEEWLYEGMPLDKRFVYFLLAAKGVCVVPVSSFCSDLLGFRVTLLEEDSRVLDTTFQLIKEGIEEYLNSN